MAALLDFSWGGLRGGTGGVLVVQLSCCPSRRLLGTEARKKSGEGDREIGEEKRGRREEREVWAPHSILIGSKVEIKHK